MEKSHRELLPFWHSKNVTEFTLGIPLRTVDSASYPDLCMFCARRVRDERGGILRPPIEKVGCDSLPAWRFNTPVSRPGRGRRRAQNDNVSESSAIARDATTAL
jgi:hypothetical protein